MLKTDTSRTDDALVTLDGGAIDSLSAESDIVALESALTIDARRDYDVIADDTDDALDKVSDDKALAVEVSGNDTLEAEDTLDIIAIEGDDASADVVYGSSNSRESVIRVESGNDTLNGGDDSSIDIITSADNPMEYDDLDLLDLTTGEEKDAHAAYGGTNTCDPYAGENTCEPPEGGGGHAGITDLFITSYSTSGTYDDIYCRRRGAARLPRYIGGRRVLSSRRQPWEETLAADTQDFPVNPQRLTPYPNFRFRLAWTGDGDILRHVAGISHAGGLARQTDVMRHRTGGDPPTEHLATGQTTYSPITLTRGVSYDPDFAHWANKVFDLKNSHGNTGQNTALGDFRKDLTLEVYNEAGRKVLAYQIFRAWVSDISALSELDAMGNALVIESMTLQNEGWQRDASVGEPHEPSFVDPASDG